MSFTIFMFHSIRADVGNFVFQQELGGTDTDDSGTSFTVDGLRPFTTYSFKVSAVNAAGRSAASEASYNAMTLRAGESGWLAVKAGRLFYVRSRWGMPRTDRPPEKSPDVMSMQGERSIWFGPIC